MQNEISKVRGLADLIAIQVVGMSQADGLNYIQEHGYTPRIAFEDGHQRTTRRVSNTKIIYVEVWNSRITGAWG